jgi:leucyl/phenylalanyl-tRNA--protein transferase
MMGSIVWLSPNDPVDSFPPVESALHEPDGLLAAGGDLSAARVLAAYRRGIFPWYSRGQPILWWSPDPRAVLVPSEIRVSRSLAKSIRNRGFETRFDSAFAAVISACGSTTVRPDGTWLSAEMREAYIELHELGFAHSVETWLEGRLVGGLYGIAIGRMFFGESMFSLERDASKVALKFLCDQLREHDCPLIDCQMATSHLLSLGAKLMPRAEFVVHVATLTRTPSAGPWDNGAARATGTSYHT